MTRALWLVALGATGCASQVDRLPDAEPIASAVKVAPPPPSASPSAARAACDAMVARFEQRKKQPAPCTTDADCACYTPIALDNALHVADKGTAADLDRMSQDYRRQACPTACAAVPLGPVCQARCVAQRCQ